MVGTITVILNQIRWFFDQKDDSWRFRQLFSLFHRQMAVTQYNLILWKTDQIQQHKIQLFSCIIKQPLLIFLNRASEKFIRTPKDSVHCGLKSRIGNLLMLFKLLIDIINQQMMPFGQLSWNRSLSAAGCSGYKINIFLVLLDYIILKYHCESPKLNSFQHFVCT